MQADFFDFKLAGCGGTDRHQAGREVSLKAAGDVFLAPRHCVSISVHGQGNGGMAESILDVAGMFSLGEKAGGMVMP